MVVLAGGVQGAYAQTLTSTEQQPEKQKKPGLRVGEKVPKGVFVTDQKGNRVILSDLYAKQPVVVMFYRGGWCPFCQKALASWGPRLSTIEELGAKMVVISPESMDHAKKSAKKSGMGYSIYVDEKLEAAKAFKVRFTVDDSTIKKYKGYGIDLETWNADKTWRLPAPGTFVIDQQGVVQFAYADWNYTKRVNPKDVIDTLHKMKGH